MSPSEDSTRSNAFESSETAATEYNFSEGLRGQYAPGKEEAPPRPPTGRLTASRLALATECPGAFALPHVQSRSEASEKGTQVHAYIEQLLTTGDTDLSAVTNQEARDIAAGLEPATLYAVVTGADLEEPGMDIETGGSGERPHLMVEQALALAPDASEAIALPPGGGHRDYSEAPPAWIRGTADTITLLGETVGNDGTTSETALITDWKTGSLLADPERNDQLRFHALAASLAYELDRIVVQLAYIDSDGDVTAASFEFGEEDLQEIARELAELSARVQDSREVALELAVGAHCRYCPAFSFCPAQAGAAQALLEEKLDEMTPAKAAEVWERLQAMESAVKKSKEALFGYVDSQDGISLPSGTQLRIVQSRRDRILPEVTMPLLREFYGDEADAAVTLTKKGLQKVAGEHSKDLLKTIEQKSGIETSYSERLQEVGKKSAS